MSRPKRSMPFTSCASSATRPSVRQVGQGAHRQLPGLPCLAARALGFGYFLVGEGFLQSWSRVDLPAPRLSTETRTAGGDNWLTVLLPDHQSRSAVGSYDTAFPDQDPQRPQKPSWVDAVASAMGLDALPIGVLTAVRRYACIGGWVKYPHPDRPPAWGSATSAWSRPRNRAWGRLGRLRACGRSHSV